MKNPSSEFRNGYPCVHSLRKIRDNNGENMKIRKKSAKNTSGQVGVYYNKTEKNWIARIKLSGESVYLGRFEHFADARDARLAAEDRVKSIVFIKDATGEYWCAIDTMTREVTGTYQKISYFFQEVVDDSVPKPAPVSFI